MSHFLQNIDEFLDIKIDTKLHPLFYKFGFICETLDF